MKKIQNILSYVLRNGVGWILFRVKYELRKRSKYFDRKNEIIRARVRDAKYDQYSFPVGLTNQEFEGHGCFIEAADNAIAGKIYSFSHEYLDYSNDGKVIDWHYNPALRKGAPKDAHWHKLPDFGEYGDIKLIWEASRFPQVYYFINAYAVTRDRKYAEACLEQIVEWCSANPFPCGVNYKCGQEIAFRLFAWIVAADYFKDFVSQNFRETVLENIHYSLLRIDLNIDYAAKSVRNNHSISEAAGLFVGGLLFSQLPESKRLIAKGIKYLKRELAYQVYDDGSYIQHSMIYQRLTLDILSFVCMVADEYSYELPEIIVESHKKLLDFLAAFVQADGTVPNYGCNDGANLFPCNEETYLDFRPSLNFACAVRHRKNMFPECLTLAELFDLDSSETYVPELKTEFRSGGYYILKNNNIFLMTRCHSYRHKPGQADMLHLDVWYKGENIFSDTGTYSYNSREHFITDFAGTAGHNTIMVNDVDHMEKVLNFGFSNWTKSQVLKTGENVFTGEQYAYKKNFGITHRREVKLFDDHVIVEDRFEGIKNNVNIKQLWNTGCLVEKVGKGEFKVADAVISSTCDGDVQTAYISDYYNQYRKGSRVIFQHNSDKDFKITTKIDFCARN